MHGLKNKIVSHLPGHKNQDKNGNGIPDRMEHNTTNTAPRTLSDMNGNGIPDNMERQQFGMASNQFGQPQGLYQPAYQQQGFATDLNRNGIPDQLERQQFLVQQQFVGQQFVGQQSIGQQSGLTDLNRNGIPDQFESQQFLGQQQSGFTDLNRNGIPDQLEGQSFTQTTYTQSGLVDVREAPTIVEQIQKPTVVHEVIKTEEVVEIQPVIEREREKLDVYEVVQPMREREVVATEVRTAVLPAQTRAAVIEDQSAFLAARSAPSDVSTREIAPTLHQTVQNAPIIHETITHKVIEEVQPVLYKEIDRPVLIKETLPIYEKVVEAPHAHHQVLPVRDLGARTVQTTTFVGTDLNRDGIPDQLQGGMAYQTTGLQSGIQSQGMLQPGFQQGLKDLNGNGIDDTLERRMANASMNSKTY